MPLLIFFNKGLSNFVVEPALETTKEARVFAAILISLIELPLRHLLTTAAKKAAPDPTVSDTFILKPGCIKKSF